MGEIYSDYKIWGLCDFGVNPDIIYSIFYKGISLDSILKNDLLWRGYVFKYPISSKQINNIVKDNIKLSKLKSDISIYSLFAFNIKKHYIEKMVSKRINFQDILNYNGSEILTGLAIDYSSVKMIIEVAKELGKYQINKVDDLSIFNILLNKIGSEEVVNRFRLKNYFNDAVKDYVATKEFDFYIDQLLIENKIKFSTEGYRLNIPTLEEFSRNLDPDKNKDFLIKMLDGQKIEHIAYTYGISKKNTESIIRNILINRPTLVEDKLKKYFKEYKISEEQFVLLFKVSKHVYNLFKFEEVQGIRSIEELIQDEKLNIDNERLLDIEDYVVIDGEYHIKSLDNLVDVFLKKTKPEKQNIAKFLHNYNDFIVNHSSKREEVMIYSEKIFENFLMKSKYILKCNTKNYRFFDYSKFDLNKLKFQLDLNKYYGTVVSSRKIFEGNILLMKEFEIIDHLELFYLLSSIYSDNESIKFSITPLIFVDIDLKNFLDKQIIELSPISILDFLNYLNDNYAIERGIVYKILVKNFSNYIVDSILNANGIHLSQKEAVNIKSKLNEGYSNIENFWQHLSQFLPGNEDLAKYKTKENIIALGYKLEHSFVFKQEYHNLEEFFSKFIVSFGNFHIEDFDLSIRGNSIFQRELRRLIKELDLIEIAESRYTNLQTLKKYGIEKRDIKKYLTSVEKKYKGNIFTLYQVVKDVDNLFDELGFDDYLIQRLLVNSELFHYKFINNQTVFSENKDLLNGRSIIKKAFGELNRIDIYEFKLQIKEIFGIDFKESEIKNYVDESTLFYNQEMDALYKTKEIFLEEIFDYE